MNALLFDAWKKAGLSEEDAKKAAIESARSDVALSMVNQSITRLEAHVDTSLTELRLQMEKTAKTNLIIIVSVIAVAVTIISVVVTVLGFTLR